ncbi:MAG: TonB-dependent siderophore receptor [Taibaiella sp.]|jgi:iron complex outermembrane receptor protein
MKKIFMIFGVMCSSFALYAQSGKVKGKIVNPDGTPATQVTVTLDDASAETTTDEHGAFLIEAEPGAHNLMIHAVGAKSRTIVIEISEDKTVSVADIHLKKGSTELSEIVIGANRHQYTTDKTSGSLRLQTPLVELPQNVQVVTMKTLADQQVTSMSDGVIRNVSGLSRLEHWGDMYARVNARGSRISAFRNGMNITSNWGPLTEDMAFVDRIEFVKGPAGFMMSNGEPSGLYNVVTKRPAGETRGEAGIMFGSYNFYRANVDLDGKFDKEGKLLFRLNALGQTKGSFRDFEFNDRYGIAPVISYQLTDQTKLTVEYIFQHAKMSNVGSYYVFAKNGYATTPRNFTLGDPGIDPTIINDHNVNVNLEHHFDSNWKLTAQASLFSYQQEGSSMWTGADSLNANGTVAIPAVSADGKIIRNVSIWDASNVMKFGQMYINGDVTTGPVHHRILGGFDLADKQYFADWNIGADLDTYEKPFDVNNPEYGSPANGVPNELFKTRRETSLRERAGVYGTVSQTSTGLYLQDELGFFEDKLRLTLAGRYTYVKTNNYNTFTTGKKFTPRFGLSYSVDRSTAVYGLYDQTFVPQDGLRRDGEAVKPVTGNNIEFGMKRDWFDGSWSTSLSVYQILKNNQVTGDPANTAGESFIVQFGQTKTQGLEFDLRGEITRGLTLIANYAYANAKISKADTSEASQQTIGNNVPGYAKHTANAWLNYTIQSGVLKGFGISGGFTWMADRSTWTWAGSTGQQPLPDYFKLDGGIYYEKDKVRITANMLNITDKYLYSGSAYAAYYYWQAEPGRNFRVGVNYRF